MNDIKTNLDNLEETVSNIASRQDDIDTKQDELNMKVMSVSSELEQNVSSEVKKIYDLLDEHVYNNTLRKQSVTSTRSLFPMMASPQPQSRGTPSEGFVSFQTPWTRKSLSSGAFLPHQEGVSHISQRVLLPQLYAS